MPVPGGGSPRNTLSIVINRVGVGGVSPVPARKIDAIVTNLRDLRDEMRTQVSLGKAV
jgi:hypothetical protein